MLNLVNINLSPYAKKMREHGLADHIETLVQGPCFVWHVLDDCVDVRYTLLDEAQEQVKNGAEYLSSDHVVTVPYSSFDKSDRDNLYEERSGLLHIMDITYQDGSIERQTVVSLQPPPPPPTPEQLEEGRKFAERIMANRLRNIPSDR